MSIRKMTFSLTSLIFLIALGLVFAPTAVMAHSPGGADAVFDQNHDGDTNATPGTPDTTETDHTHRSAPTVTSIELVDVKPGTDAATKAASASTVDGRSVVLVDDADAAADAAVTAITDFTASGTAGQFRIKITFSEDVYDAEAQAANFGAALADAALTGDVIGGITAVAASQAAPTAQITTLNDWRYCSYGRFLERIFGNCWCDCCGPAKRPDGCLDKCGCRRSL